MKSLMGVDECMREAWAIDVAGAIRSARVVEVLARLVSERGTAPSALVHRPELLSLALPHRISDNQIRTARIEPGKPWQNGTSKRFNSTLRDECLSVEWFCLRIEARVLIESWRRRYNEERLPSSPHSVTPQEFPQQHLALSNRGALLQHWTANSSMPEKSRSYAAGASDFVTADAPAGRKLDRAGMKLQGNGGTLRLARSTLQQARTQPDIARMKLHLAGSAADIAEMKLQIAGMKLQIVGVKLQIAEMKLQIVRIKLQIAGMKLQIARMKLQIARMKLQIARMKLQIARMKLQIARMKLQIARMKLQIVGMKLQIAGMKLQERSIKPRPGGWQR